MWLHVLIHTLDLTKIGHLELQILSGFMSCQRVQCTFNTNYNYMYILMAWHAADATFQPMVAWLCDVNDMAIGWSIVLFHKSQDTLLHPGLNDQIQNTLFTEDPHLTRARWVCFDWLPGLACADLNWSALVNHIGIHPLPATQPTLIGHALYIKPRPSQFSVPHVPPCRHGNGEIFVCNI